MRRRRALLVLAFLAAGLFLAPPAFATPPRPADLWILGGEDAWHPSTSFEATWSNPSIGGGPFAVRCRIRDPLGAVIAEQWLGRTSDGVSGLTVPKAPGIYTLEVWFEDSAGTGGPAASARLRFDDERPAATAIEGVPSWIGRTALPLRVELGHPSGKAPLAGLGGYAAVIDATPSGEPCAAADRCTETETTLRGGGEDDTLTIASLPEGISHLHAVAVSGSGMKSAAGASAPLRVDLTDPVTQLTGAPPGWTNRTVDLFAAAADAGAGMAAGAAVPSFTAIRVDDEAPAIFPGAYASAKVVTEGGHLVSFYARDAAGNVNDGGDGNGIPDRPPRTAWVRIDRGAPDVAFANSEDPQDPDLLRAWVADSLSGPDPARSWIGVRRAGSGDGFEPLPSAMPRAGELRARWDSDSYPPGRYEFRAVGYDEAGNRESTTLRRSGAPMVVSNPLKASTALFAHLGSGPTEQTVPYGRGTSLSGRLITGRASPLAAAPVRILERFAAGSGTAARATTARTDAAGRFSAHLAPGPSREIAVTFDGSATLARSASGPLRLDVRTSVRLRASARTAEVGGAPLVFRGLVVGEDGAIPAKGVPVELQFRLAGLPWSEFRTVQTGRRGRFRYAYRFSDDDSRGARFQFRAYVAAQDDWPYEPGGSRPVIVLGR